MRTILLVRSCPHTSRGNWMHDRLYIWYITNGMGKNKYQYNFLNLVLSLCQLLLWCTKGFLIVVRAHQFFLYAETWVTVFFVILIIKVDSSGRDFIFDRADQSKSSDFQNGWESTNSPMNCKHYKKAEYLDKSSWTNGSWRRAASL